MISIKYDMIVISLGGSVIVPNEIDLKFIREFSRIIRNSKEQLVIVCGGGSTARKYQNAARILKSSKNDLDWIGICATQLNAELVKRALNIEHSIISDPSKKLKTKKHVVTSGWKPGFSTDYDAVLIAVKNHARFIINVSNTDYIYDTDPHKNKNAKLFRYLTWSEYFEKILHKTKWKPGMHIPFDPKASQLAKKNRIKVFFVKGIGDTKAILHGRKFKGTVIE